MWEEPGRRRHEDDWATGNRSACNSLHKTRGADPPERGGSTCVYLVIGLVGVGSLVAVLAGLAVAQSSKPDATLNLSGGSVAAGIGYSWGNGTLSYNGKTYPVRIEGLSVGPAGVSRIKHVVEIVLLSRTQGASVAVGVEGIRLTLVN